VARYRDGAGVIKGVTPPEDFETILYGVHVDAARGDVEHIRYFEIDTRAIANASMEPSGDDGVDAGCLGRLTGDQITATPS
jgi:hypothetical protein